MKNWVAKYGASALALNAGWMLLGQGLSLVIQAAYFVIIARSLGVQQYGAFVAAAALAQIASPFVGLGGGNLLIKNVARDRAEFPVYWGNLLVMTLISALASVGIVIGVAGAILPHSVALTVILCVVVSELVFVRLAECAAMAFQAIERLDRMAQLRIVGPLARFIGIGALALIVRHPTAVEWSAIYLATTVASAVVGIALVHAQIGRPRLAVHRMRGELAEGLNFCVSLSAQSIYNDIDKTMLARMSTLDAVGIYAAAYRLIDVAFIPVRAVLAAGYAGFFRAGQDGVRGALGYARRLLPRSAAYSLSMCIVLVASAPIIPRIVGPEYARTVDAVRWLAVLPLVKTLQYFLADVLTCSGYQGRRALLQVAVAGFNVLLNLWVIPAYSWRGAAWSSVASDVLLAVLLGVAVLRLGKRAVRGAAVRRVALRVAVGHTHD